MRYRLVDVRACRSPRASPGTSMAAQGDGRMRVEVETLFHEVAELSPEARTQYFVEHNVDEDTRREVEALLAYDSGASSFLLRDVGIAASRALGDMAAASMADDRIVLTNRALPQNNLDENLSTIRLTNE